MVVRVRQLLEDIDLATRVPANTRALARLSEAVSSGSAGRDIREMEERLERIRLSFPDLDVELGPLVARARNFLEDGGGLQGLAAGSSATGASPAPWKESWKRFPQ